LASTAEERSHEIIVAPVVVKISVKRPAPEPTSNIVWPESSVGHLLAANSRLRDIGLPVKLSS
jgi:hypothetical protein